MATCWPVSRPTAGLPAGVSWREWGGEATLVLLLEQMATGDIRSPRLNGAGTVRGGVGLSAEIPSLFYLDFSTSEAGRGHGRRLAGGAPRPLGGADSLLPPQTPKSAAARLGLYGLSAGEDPDGEGLVVGGTRAGDKREIIRPHYVLMSALAQSRPEAAYDSPAHDAGARSHHALGHGGGVHQGPGTPAGDGRVQRRPGVPGHLPSLG